MRVTSLSKQLGLENLLAMAAVLMEVLRVYPWLVWFGHILNWGQAPLSLFSSLAILGVTAYTAKRTLGKAYSLNRVRLTTLSVGIGLLIVLIRLEHSAGYALWDMSWKIPTNRLPILLLAMGFGVYLLWRGITLGREDLRSDYLYRNFTISTVGFILLIIIWGASLRTVTRQVAFINLSPYVLGYFFAALLAMGLSNYRERLRRIGGASSLLTRRWLLVLLLIVLAIVLIAAAAASSLSLDFMDGVLRLFSVLANWLATAFVYLVFYPLGIMLTGLFYVIRFLLALLRGNQRPEMPKLPDFSDLPERTKENVLQLPPNLILALKLLLLLLVVSAIIFFLARLLSRFSRGRQDKEVSEIHRSLWSWEGFKADVLAFLRNLLSRFRKRASIHPIPSPPASVTTEDISQLQNIREIYRGLLWEGQWAGVPKRIGETPYEYQQTLLGRKPVQEEVAAVTEAYMQERYGHVPIASGRLTGLARIWLRLRSALRSRDEDVSGKP